MTNNRLIISSLQLVGLELEWYFYQFQEFLTSLFHILIIFVKLPHDFHAFDVFKCRKYVEN